MVKMHYTHVGSCGRVRTKSLKIIKLRCSWRRTRLQVKGAESPLKSTPKLLSRQ